MLTVYLQFEEWSDRNLTNLSALPVDWRVHKIVVFRLEHVYVKSVVCLECFGSSFHLPTLMKVDSSCFSEFNFSFEHSSFNTVLVGMDHCSFR